MHIFIGIFAQEKERLAFLYRKKYFGLLMIRYCKIHIVTRTHTHTHIYIYIYIYIHTYIHTRMLPNETTVLHKNVPYVKLHGYDKKILNPILKGFGHKAEKEVLRKKEPS